MMLSLALWLDLLGFLLCTVKIVLNPPLTNIKCWSKCCQLFLHKTTELISTDILAVFLFGCFLQFVCLFFNNSSIWWKSILVKTGQEVEGGIWMPDLVPSNISLPSQFHPFSFCHWKWKKKKRCISNQRLENNPNQQVLHVQIVVNNQAGEGPDFHCPADLIPSSLAKSRGKTLQPIMYLHWSNTTCKGAWPWKLPSSLEVDWGCFLSCRGRAGWERELLLCSLLLKLHHAVGPCFPCSQTPSPWELRSAEGAASATALPGPWGWIRGCHPPRTTHEKWGRGFLGYTGLSETALGRSLESSSQCEETAQITWWHGPLEPKLALWKHTSTVPGVGNCIRVRFPGGRTLRASSFSVWPTLRIG